MSDGPMRSVGIGALFGLGAAEAPPPGPGLPDLLASERARGRAEGEAAAAGILAVERTEAEERHRQQMSAATAAARAAHDELARAISGDFARLLVDALAAILATQPPLDVRTVQSLVAEALTAAPADGAGRLWVHPEMLDAARPMVPEGWRLAPDPALAWGSVRAEVDESLFSASLARRLQQIGVLLAGEG